VSRDREPAFRRSDLPNEDHPSGDAQLSIGALAKATGIPADTLRTWERRYGFPKPDRKPSGHRTYSLTHVPRLRRIAEALGQGNRAGDVLAASDRELDALLATIGGGNAAPSATGAYGGEDRETLLEAVERFDAAQIAKSLMAAWGRLGPCEFLDTCVGPFLRDIGEAWEHDRLTIAHEHFASERVSDVLRTLRGPLEARSRGPLIVLATLPGESHSLGLQMAGLVIVAAGCRVLLLGTEMPVSEIAGLGNDFGARAVGVSVSSATCGATTARDIRELRTKLPSRTELLVGGAGAPKASAGVTILPTVATLDHWARRAAINEPP